MKKCNTKLIVALILLIFSVVEIRAQDSQLNYNNDGININNNHNNTYSFLKLGGNSSGTNGEIGFFDTGTNKLEFKFSSLTKMELNENGALSVSESVTAKNYKISGGSYGPMGFSTGSSGNILNFDMNWRDGYDTSFPSAAFRMDRRSSQMTYELFSWRYSKPGETPTPSGHVATLMNLGNDGVLRVSNGVIVGGSTSASLGSFMFEVHGKAAFKEAVKVHLSGEDFAWPDYVFADDYALSSLNEVEDFIKTNGHLPEVPSEKEMIEQGLEVVSMNATLLKKIEELTLYTIAQEKEISNLNQKLQKVEELEKKLEKLLSTAVGNSSN